MTQKDFNELVNQLSRRMYGYAFRILSKQEEAEDAVQEVFIKLWNMKDKLSEYNNIEAFITTMTKNHCIDQIRKRKNIKLEEYSNRDYNDLFSATPQEQLERKEAGLIIHEIISELPETTQKIIRMKEIEELSYEEIAEKTGQNTNALRVIISRGRKFIRDEFNKYNYERKGITGVSRQVL